jgi:hypothetical protein
MGHVPLCRSISEGRTAFCLACSTPDWGRADRSEGGLQHRWLRRSRFSALAPRQSRDGSVGRLHTVERGVFDPSVEYRLHRVPVSLQPHYGQTPVTHRLHAVLPCVRMVLSDVGADNRDWYGESDRHLSVWAMTVLPPRGKATSVTGNCGGKVRYLDP